MKTRVVKKDFGCEKQYPKLMVHCVESLPNYGMIVLFSKRGSGCVVHTEPKNNWCLGQKSEHISMDNFIDLDGEIILSN